MNVLNPRAQFFSRLLITFGGLLNAPSKVRGLSKWLENESEMVIGRFAEGFFFVVASTP